MTHPRQKERALNELVGVFDSQLFRALAEPVRIEILKTLLLRGRMDIQSIAKEINKDRSVLSRHMHLLAGVGLLSTEKVSRNVYFEINAEVFVGKIRALFNQVNKAIETCCGN
ncbi:MAG: helix-turn-helix domain-containing protein [Proteobacteria bacterium]|jgi:DNA-binding transcriptional ArsR family regulator|nr:helix-turn-helix domain-containing protein [Pseudomonadota bacterium]